MATVVKENYLKALYFLSQKNSDISLTELGNVMGVSKPTVNNMVKKFQTKGWIIYEKYKPLKFTELGKKAAALVVRKHRLSEMFLCNIMGFGWEEVHDIAEELEHINSDKLFDRMDELLGFPTVDPHGSPIPDKEGNFIKANYQLLSQIPPDTEVILRGLRNSSTELLLYLNNKELQLGTKILIHHIEPFDKSMQVSYLNHSKVILSAAVSNLLLVERL